MVSGIVVTFLLILFVGASFWVWHPVHKAEFDAAAQMPLSDDEEKSV